MSEEIVEFAVDQRVVYPSQGVGQIKDIFEMKKKMTSKELIAHKERILIILYIALSIQMLGIQVIEQKKMTYLIKLRI